MKKLIKIPTYQIGLVFKDMKLVKVLTEGSRYWRKWGETVENYSIFTPFQLTTRNLILIKDDLLQPYLNVFEVKENELLFKYRGDLFQDIFTKGTYAFWKNPLNETFKIVDTNEVEVTKDLAKLYKSNFVLQNYMTRHEVLSNESAILLKDEQFVKVLGSGSYFFWKNNTKIELKKVDLRQQMIEINGQEILTQDKANLRINMDAKFAVVDVKKALLDNKNFANMLYTLLQSKLRAYVGQFTLDQLLEQKSDIGKDILSTVVDQAKTLGVRVFQTEIRDVILPGDVKGHYEPGFSGSKKSAGKYHYQKGRNCRNT